jgi:TonB family protein
MKKGVTGTVYITFIIEKDGTLTNAKVLRGIGSGCDEEALRVVNMMPKWNPGEQKGKPVAVQFNLPIKFKLDSDKNGKPK